MLNSGSDGKPTTLAAVLQSRQSKDPAVVSA